jgi:hypothetical protein
LQIIFFVKFTNIQSKIKFRRNFQSLISKFIGKFWRVQ